MGRESRLKNNPSRERYRAEREGRSHHGPEHRYQGDPSRLDEENLQTAAVHEAGHVVCAFALGFGVEFTILHANERGIGGYTAHNMAFLGKFTNAEEARAASTRPDVLKIRTMQALAGKFAESCVNTQRADLDAGCHGDMLDATRLALIALGQGASTEALLSYINTCEEETEKLLTPLLPAVTRVANYLLAHPNEEVPGETLHALMEV